MRYHRHILLHNSNVKLLYIKLLNTHSLWKPICGNKRSLLTSIFKRVWIQDDIIKYFYIKTQKIFSRAFKIGLISQFELPLKRLFDRFERFCLALIKCTLSFSTIRRHHGRERLTLKRFYGNRVITITWSRFNSHSHRTHCCVLG